MPFKRGAIVEYKHNPNHEQFAKFDGAIGVITGQVPASSCPNDDETRWFLSWIVADREQHERLNARRKSHDDTGYPEYLLRLTGGWIDLGPEESVG